MQKNALRFSWLMSQATLEASPAPMITKSKVFIKRNTTPMPSFYIFLAEKLKSLLKLCNDNKTSHVFIIGICISFVHIINFVNVDLNSFHTRSIVPYIVSTVKLVLSSCPWDHLLDQSWHYVWVWKFQQQVMLLTLSTRSCWKSDPNTHLCQNWKYWSFLSKLSRYLCYQLALSRSRSSSSTFGFYLLKNHFQDLLQFSLTE